MTELHLYRVYNVDTGHQFKTAATSEKAREFRVNGYEIEDLGPTHRSADYEVEALHARLPPVSQKVSVKGGQAATLDLTVKG